MFDPVEYMAEHEHEQLVFCNDRETGLRALIAIHNTILGPSLGGTRLWTYDTTEAAIWDVLRLSEGMTYKSAVAGLPLGGGKSVIIADGKESDPAIRAARFRALGRFIDGLGGRYIAAEDVGTKPADMVEMRKETQHIAGMPTEDGGSGDPSPMTAFGVFSGIKALAEDVFRTTELKDLRVAVQGLGKVGMALTEHLVDAGAKITATDIRPEKRQEATERFGVQTVAPDAIYDVECDIFSPNALGAVINDMTIPRLKCKVIAGSANNQLEDVERHGHVLHDMGIVYAVDYVINSGGIINVYQELVGYDAVKARARTAEVYYTIKKLLMLARTENITTERAATKMARQVLYSEQLNLA